MPLRVRNLSRATELGDRLEVADSLWAKFMGLMGRPALDPGAGLWLTDSNGIHMMFMRFPIDAVFLGRPDPARDDARVVVSVHRGSADVDRAGPARAGRERRAGAAGRDDRAERDGRRRPHRPRTGRRGAGDVRGKSG